MWTHGYVYIHTCIYLYIYHYSVVIGNIIGKYFFIYGLLQIGVGGYLDKYWQILSKYCQILTTHWPGMSKTDLLKRHFVFQTKSARGHLSSHKNALGISKRFFSKHMLFLSKNLAATCAAVNNCWGYQSIWKCYSYR